MPSCILCNSKAIINQQDNAGRKIYNCPLCGMFVVSDLVEKRVAANASRIASYLMSRKLKDLNDVIFISFENNHEEKGYVQLTVEQILEYYPVDFSGKMEGALANLANRSGYPGDEIIVDKLEQAPLLYVDRPRMEALLFMISALEDLGWVKTSSYTSASFSIGIIVTSQGWRHMDSIHRDDASSEIALVCAPMFAQGDDCWKGIQKACRTTGYQMTTLTNTGEGAPISPALIAQIKSARIVICELSGKDPESYYVAGMAKALGKLVILACQEKKKNRLPVDCEQMSMLFWDTHEMLSQKLVFAIQALL